MSVFFPSLQESSPFFQLINEIDRASRPEQQRQRCQPKQRTFTPAFDVKETKDTYQLYGELPGLIQSDVNIEWADDKTITISGRSDRKYKPAVPKSAVAETKPVETESPASEDGFEEITNEQASYQKPSVEDESSASSNTESEKPAESAQKQETAQPTPAPLNKYWIAERSIGTFERTFQFPIRVEHDNVKASLKNGILAITIPKAKPLEPKKIVIQ